MIIQTNINNFILHSEEPIGAALKKLELNKSKIIFVVTKSNNIVGSISDGDIRRWLQNTSTPNIDQTVSNIAHYKCLVLSEDLSESIIARSFSSKISVIPLVDKKNRIVSVACDTKGSITIGGKEISDRSDTYIIAEIGNNHNGSLDLARRLVDEAVRSGANCAKFQMRSMGALYGDAAYDKLDLGSQYIFDLLSKYQLLDDEMFEIFDYCHTKNITPLCTPFDIESLHKLDEYGLEAYKIASADFTNHDFLEEVSNKEKPMICSTGMAHEVEVIEGIDKLKSLKAQYILLHCNSTYPAPFKDVNLNYMKHLKSLSGVPIGYSGHERDIFVSIAAVSLGAKVIEKHFTLDRKMEGNDHRVSLLPNEFNNMVQGIRQVEDALGDDHARAVSQGEMMNRENLAKSLVAMDDIEPYTIISDNLIDVKSPGSGIQPNKKHIILGKQIYISKKKGELFYDSDFNQENRIATKKYQFPLRWGIPVRYHDIEQLTSIANIDLVEIHLSSSDLEVDFRQYLHNKIDKGLVVHCPELFAGDNTLDLCADNEEYRVKSVGNLQDVIDLTVNLNKYFTNKAKPVIVTNVGGFSSDSSLNENEINKRYEILVKSLSELDMEKVEIIPQTMPPFPWHYGGQQFHNLFVDAKTIVKFCQENSMRICLDVSHSKLACNQNNWIFSDFLQDVAPYVAHMHISDSEGVDGEGLQIGKGDIDWRVFWGDVGSYIHKDVTFIPEVWQGHKNNGEEMWKGLEILEKHYHASKGMS